VIKIVKKVIVFTLILVILLNSIVIQKQKYYVYADVLVLPGLTIKMLACLLAALGVYAASEIDYVKLYNVAVDMIDDVKYLGAIARNAIVNRVIPNVKGYYEDIMEWIQSLNISENFRDINIGTTGAIPVQGVTVSHGEIRVNITGNTQVMQIGGTFIKAEKRQWVEWPCYDIYCKQDLEDGWAEIGFIDGNQLILRESDDWGNYILYDVYYYNEVLEVEDYAYCSILVPLEYEPVEYLPGVPVDVTLKKVKDIGLESTEIGLIVDGYYTGEFDTWQEYLDYLNDIASVDNYWLERFMEEYDINYTDVITPDIGLERIPLDELESYPDIPGVDNPIDIPMDPTVPVGEIVIPDEQVLEETIPEDSVVPGLGLIIRLLRYIGNALKIAILTPVNVIKEGVISMYDVVREIPGYIEGVIDSVREIPGQIVDAVEDWFGRVMEKMREIAEKLGTLPEQIADAIEGFWSDVREKVGEIADAIEGFWSDVREKVGEVADNVVAIPGQVVEGVTGVIDDVKGWFEGLLVPTLEIDLSPLQVGTIKEKFPFSIPWDMQRILGQLVDEPEVPKWTAEILGEELVIDFATFEPLAKIVRWAVVIMFVIGLIKFYSMFI